MPKFVHGPTLTALNSTLNSSLNAPQSDAIFALLQAIPAPPDRPGLGRVIRSAVTCCEAAWRRMAVVPEEIVGLLRHLHSACSAFEPSARLDCEALMRGQRTRYPAWSFFALLDSNAPEEIKLLAGAALLQATTLGQPIKSKITARLCQLINHDGTQASSQDLNHARSYAGKLLADVAATYPLRKVKLQQLQLAARIRASLAGQLDAPNLDDRRACSTAREATTQECLEVGPLLKLRAEAGDGLAIAIVVAHCSGPVWDIVLDIPFSDAAPDDWAALIDVRQGIVKIDLGSVLPDLARALPGHEPASCVMQIPLPVFCADALQRSVSSNPNATCLRELFSLSQVTANTVLPGTPKDAPIKLSIARFVRARGTFAIWAGSLREVAAYATGDPVKVGKSSHHYVTIDLGKV